CCYTCIALYICCVPGEQLLGHPVEQFLAEETRASTRGYFEQAFQGQAVSFHLKAVAADGRQSDLSIVLVPMTTDGVVTSVLGIAKNITARKLAEQDLHRERQTLQLVLHTIPQMVFWKTVDGVYQGANRRMLEFAGLQTVDEIVGKTDRDMPWR